MFLGGGCLGTNRKLGSTFAVSMVTEVTVHLYQV